MKKLFFIAVLALLAIIVQGQPRQGGGPFPSGVQQGGAFIGNGAGLTNLHTGTSSDFSRWNVKDFGAVGNGKINNFGAMVSNSAALIVTQGTFTAGDVGKVISVYAAGVKPTGWTTTNQAYNLTTTIAAFTDANHVTLAATAQTTVNNAPLIWGDDDTAAVQRAINYVTTNNNFSGGTLFFPVGNYIINGPIINASPLAGGFEGKNAQLFLPDGVPSVDYNWAETVRFEGPLPQAQRQLIQGGLYAWTNYSACIWSTLPNLNGGNVFSCYATNVASAAYVSTGHRGLSFYPNKVRVEFKNMIWRAAGNPNGVCLNLQGAPTMDLQDVLIDTGWAEYSVLAQPTSTNGYGLLLATPSSGGASQLKHVTVCGFWTGVLWGEHLDVSGLEIFSCYNGIEPCNGGHFGRFTADFEDVHTFFNNRLHAPCIFQGSFTSESVNTGSPWSFPPVLVDDATDALGGDIAYWNSSYGADFMPHIGGNHVVWRVLTTAGTERYATQVNFTNAYTSTLGFGSISASPSANWMALTASDGNNQLDALYNDLSAATRWAIGFHQATEGISDPFDWRFKSYNIAGAPSPTTAMALGQTTGTLKVYSNIVAGGVFIGDGSSLTNITPVITNFTTYASGTAYTLTGTSAALDFGTTDPILTINKAGTYLIQGNVGVKYNGATYAGAQTVTFKFRRTNNTAADLSNGSRAVELPVLTTFTGGDVMALPPVIYTATSGDILTVFGILSAVPAAGAVLADSAEIVAIRLY